MRKLLISAVLVSFLFAQPPAELVKSCSLKIESFVLSREVFPRLAIASIKNHSLRSQGFIENLYELFTSDLSDYLLPSEGVIGFDRSGGFFSPPPGYDFLLKITYKELDGEAGLFVRIYSKEGKLVDFLSCTGKVEELAYREFETPAMTPSTPLVLWDAQIPPFPLAVMKNGEDIFVLYPDRIVKYKKTGGILREKASRQLTWPSPTYPSQDLRGFIRKVSLEDGIYLSVGISSSASYLFLNYSDLSPAMILPWMVLYQGEDKVYLGKFLPGRNYFAPVLAILSLPLSLQDLASAEGEGFPPFYDLCFYQGSVNIVDENGVRKVFKDGEEVPSPLSPVGDEIECWGDLFVNTAFGSRESVSFQSFTTLNKRGALPLSGRVIFMSRSGPSRVILLSEEGGKFWIKEIRLE